VKTTKKGKAGLDPLEETVEEHLPFIDDPSLYNNDDLDDEEAKELILKKRAKNEILVCFSGRKEKKPQKTTKRRIPRAKVPKEKKPRKNEELEFHERLYAQQKSAQEALHRETPIVFPERKPPPVTLDTQKILGRAETLSVTTEDKLLEILSKKGSNGEEDNDEDDYVILELSDSEDGDEIHQQDNTKIKTAPSFLDTHFPPLHQPILDTQDLETKLSQTKTNTIMSQETTPTIVNTSTLMSKVTTPIVNTTTNILRLQLQEDDLYDENDGAEPEVSWDDEDNSEQSEMDEEEFRKLLDDHCHDQEDAIEKKGEEESLSEIITDEDELSLSNEDNEEEAAEVTLHSKLNNKKMKKQEELENVNKVFQFRATKQDSQERNSKNLAQDSSLLVAVQGETTSTLLSEVTTKEAPTRKRTLPLREAERFHKRPRTSKMIQNYIQFLLIDEMSQSESQNSHGGSHISNGDSQNSHGISQNSHRSSQNSHGSSQNSNGDIQNNHGGSQNSHGGSHKGSSLDIEKNKSGSGQMGLLKGHNEDSQLKESQLDINMEEENSDHSHDDAKEEEEEEQFHKRWLRNEHTKSHSLMNSASSASQDYVEEMIKSRTKPTSKQDYTDPYELIDDSTQAAYFNQQQIISNCKELSEKANKQQGNDKITNINGSRFFLPNIKQPQRRFANIGKNK